MRKLNKHADINLSFGVIFSIILIAVFVFAAIYAIKFFLDYSECSQVGSFYDNLQREVTNAYMSQSTENRKVSINLPKGIEKICFANLSAIITNPGEDYEEIRDFYLDDYNLFLIPLDNACNLPYRKIERINVSRIIQNENPYCIENANDILLTKKIYDRTVFIERA